MEVSGQLHGPAALPRERVPCMSWLRGWLGSRAGLDRGISWLLNT